MASSPSSSPARPGSSAATCSSCSTSDDVADRRAGSGPGTEPLVQRHARALGHRRDARSRRGGRGDRRRSSRRRSITWPACRTSATRGRTRARPSRATCSRTHHLFDALRRAGLQPRVLDHQLGDRLHARRSRRSPRTTRSRPNSPYGTSKLAQEMVAARAWEDDGIPALIARAFNHIGPRQAPAFVAPSIAQADRRDRSGPSCRRC